MDYFKSQLDRIQQQLAGLNASQKMLAACLVAIIVMTVAWWGGQAGTSEMEPLFDQALAPEEAGRIRKKLAVEGIKATVRSDNRITVPAAQAPEALAVLASANSLPKNPKINFASFMKELNPFAAQSTNEAHLNHFKQLAVAEMIGNMEGVREAAVIIDPSREVRIGSAGIEPSASISITLDEGVAATQDLANAAASLVCGAQASVKRDRVSIAINDKPWVARDADDLAMSGSAQIDILDKHERRMREVILNHIGIPGMSAFVHYEVNAESKLTKSKTVDPKNVIQKETSTRERTVESTTPAGGGISEPGVMPNSPMVITPSVSAAAGNAATSNETETESKFEVAYGESEVQVKTPAGIASPKKASVRIPRSYVINILKAANANAPEPDEKAIQAQLAAQTAEIRAGVKNCTGIDDDANVSVAMFYDFAPPAMALAGTGMIPAGPSTTSTVAALANAHSREIVLGGLAVVSLFMVSMMVRKGGPTAVAIPAGFAGMMPMPVLDASEALAGEVGEGKSMLDAMELDEDAVRAQQMVDQVAAMVEDNPDAAAGLVKRWMSRT